MSIPITDKFKPKNNGGFALMDAADVEMPDGSRLSDFKGGVTSVNGQTGAVNITAINGKDGKDGKDGTNGKDGVSPSVTVVAITGGHRVSITDANSTITFDVMNGKDGDEGGGTSITVDSELSETSENPVQNKVITAYFNEAVQTLGQLQASIPTETQINALIDAYLSEALGGDY